MPVIDEKIILRDKNQMTIPKAVVEACRLRQGQPLIVHIDDEHPDEIILRVLPESYAGALTGIFAGVDAADHVAAERVSWD
jgi:bifunctional DNA-binding transcriptional regulator/antitoxin component of YhaV-PrlF toxin-antitoxin module